MMTVLKKIGKFVLGGGLLGSILGGGKKKALPQPLPGATRDDAAALIASEDELRKRRGGLDDILTGTRGAEAALQSGRLVVGN
jgi:hypothetical protein